MLFWIYAAIALVCAVCVVIGTHLVSAWGDCWIPIVLFCGIFAALLLAHFILLFIGSLLIPKRSEPKKMDNLYRFMGLESLSLFMMMVGLRITVTGREKLPDEPFLLVSNHISNYDPLVLMTELRRQRLAFVSKKENGKIFILGRYMIPCGCLFLDREDTRAAIDTINKAADFIRSGKGSMGICPEGTRNKTEEILLPFHAGSFKIATKAKCPLVIAVVKGTEKSVPFRKTTVEVNILDTLPPETVCSMRTVELADYSEKMMRTALEQ